MLKRKVISYDNLPAKAPIYQIAIVFLVMDRFSAPEWSFWVVGTLSVLRILRSLVKFAKQEQLNVWEKIEEVKHD